MPNAKKWTTVKRALAGPDLKRVSATQLRDVEEFMDAITAAAEADDDEEFIELVDVEQLCLALQSTGLIRKLNVFDRLILKDSVSGHDRPAGQLV